MNVSANGKVVLTATRELARKWEETRHHWSDAKSIEFERSYLAGLFADVERSMPILEELDRLMTNVRNQCE
ncbi:MAG TPA: hypothetical protein VM735_01145 [Candidatus Kapabacteria bacterium]|nr:hypothetical protein [Candidatus Kapabacteria bacterium]